MFDGGQNLECMHAELHSATFSTQVSEKLKGRGNLYHKEGRYCTVPMKTS
jgi:hypothetical protein